MDTVFSRVASMSRLTIASSGGLLSACAAIAIVLLFVFGAGSLRADDSAANDPAFFQAKIEPLLKSKCYGCHGTKRQKAELNLASPEAILKGGESGPVVVAGKPDESPLFEMVRDGLMPPKKKDRLSDDQVELIRRWIASGARLDAGEAPEERQLTLHDIKPFLLLRCTACHGTRRQEGGLDLRTYASMLRGGKAGPAIVPGRPEESLILKRILAEEMPPRRRLVEVSVKTMTDHEVDLLTRWIAQGAVESDALPDVATRSPDPLVSDDERSFWSFRSPELVRVPGVSESDRRRNPIDAFVAKKLSERALTLSPEADRRTLVRRAYFDLVGLPPDPDTVDAFVVDPDPRAYEKLVDRLLASPRYGERWARYWLDLAGYSDSEGVQHSDRVRTHAYRYRDYVIRSFNSDKPYDEFLLEQIAGDELDDHASAEVITDEMYDRLVATGFLRMTTDGTYFQITNFVPDRLEQIADELDVLGASVMGLTLKCARCHSHKFDPIPQRDYYRLAAVFKGAYDEHDWLPPGKRILPYVTTAERQEWDAREAKLKTALKPHQGTLEKLRAEATQRQVEKRLAELPKTLWDDLRAMLSIPKDQRDEVQKYLAMKFEEKLRVDPDDLVKIDEEFKSAAEPVEKEIKRLEGERTPEPGVRALWDRGEPSPTYLLQRGNYLTSGRLIGPGVPSVLTDGRTPLDLVPPWAGAKKTGRRLAFARWLTSSDHPLTARVIVNRVWKHHFGRGIVKTLDNFGRAGARPTHPELLDWLAVKFVENGWRLKYLHRLMMLSSVYRQSSGVSGDDGATSRVALDPDGRWYSRMPIRRLDAEVLRDSLIAVTGKLDRTAFGPATGVEQREDGMVTSLPSEKGWRRSIYVLQRRSQRVTILENFDQPAMSPNCVERTESIVAPQALHLLNNATVHDLSVAFAQRVLDGVGEDRARQVRRVYRLAFGRDPDGEELSAARDLIGRLTAEWEAAIAVDQESVSGDGAASGGESADTPDGDPRPTKERSFSELGASGRALANFCHAVMNSAEFLYID